MNADNVAICYAADTLQTVTSRNNSKLVLLLDKLASHDVITYNWQSVIAKTSCHQFFREEITDPTRYVINPQSDKRHHSQRHR